MIPTPSRSTTSRGICSYASSAGAGTYFNRSSLRSGNVPEYAGAAQWIPTGASGTRADPFEIVPGDFDIGMGYDTCKRWLKEGKLPTAVFAGDDNIALGVINALMEAGIQVPEEVAVVGYDDHYIASQLHPHLTTIRQPADKIGLAAADMLLKRISGKMKRGAGMRIDPELIVRESTGAE